MSFHFWKNNATILQFVYLSSFGVFLHFRSERRLGARLATSRKGELKVGVVIVLPRLLAVDMLHKCIILPFRRVQYNMKKKTICMYLKEFYVIIM